MSKRPISTDTPSAISSPGSAGGRSHSESPESPPSTRLWTGSCPCQPFSAAGSGAGFGDERHLWPVFERLIAQCRPPAIFGEQVASKAVGPWIDLVQTDLEALGYAVGAVAFPSASVGAPHIRDRTYWVGYANDSGLEGHWGRLGAQAGHRQGAIRPVAPAGESLWLANTDGEQRDRCGGERPRGRTEYPIGGDAIGPADPSCPIPLPRYHFPTHTPGVHRGQESAGSRDGELERHGAVGGPGPVNGFWGASDWLGCRDGKWRPVEPGAFPLARGVSARVGRLRAYGNAINPYQAAAFIEASMP